MTRTFVIFILIALLFGMISCSKVKVDPNPGMGFQVLIDQNSSITGPGSVKLDTAYLRLEEIEFEAEKTEDEEVEIEIEQLTTIDLISGTSNPQLPSLNISSGHYEELELEARGAEDGGFVLYLFGTVEDSAQNLIPVRVEMFEPFSLEMEWENFVVDSTVAFGATFFIDPSAWFTGIHLQDIQQADRDANGVVNITPNDNTGLYNQLKAVLGEGIEWEWDD